MTNEHFSEGSENALFPHKFKLSRVCNEIFNELLNLRIQSTKMSMKKGV